MAILENESVTTEETSVDAEIYDIEPPYDKNLSDEEINKKVDELFAEVENDDVDEEVDDEPEEKPDGEEKPEATPPETTAEKVPEPPKKAPESLELKAYKKMFEDADAIAKEEMFGSLLEKIAEAKGMSVDEYKKTIFGDTSSTPEPPATKEASTNDAISALLAKKEQDDIAVFAKVDPNTSVKSLNDLADKDKYIKLVDSGISPADAYLVIQKDVIASRKVKAEDNKSHMRSSASKPASGAPLAIPPSEMRIILDILGEKATEAEAIQYYKRVNK